MHAPVSLVTKGSTSDGTPCAIKRLRPDDQLRDDLALRLDNERRVLTLLAGTPGVIRLLGFRLAPLSLMLEWADGGSLDRRLELDDLGIAEIRRVLLDLVAAVSECHRHGVTHRDVKPSNVLFVAGELRLADFGVAAWGTPRRALPDGWEESEIGTPPWSAPELCGVGGAAAIAPAVDVYGVARTAEALLRRGPALAGLPSALPEWIDAALQESPLRRPGLGELAGIL